jgi:hypothetical protein
MLHAAKPFWTDLVWRTYESVPAGTDVFFHLGRRYVMPLLRYVVPVARARGRTAADGRPGSILMAGSGAQLLYLQRRFFIDAEIEDLGRCPVHALRRTLLAQGAEDDLIVARVARCLAGAISGGRFLRVPDLVDVWLDVRDRNETARRMSKVMRRTSRALLEYGFSWSERHDPSDFECFYDNYYLPFASARHHEMAVVRERPVLRRHFRSGGILWIAKDGEEVAAALYRIDGGVCTALAVGTRNGSLEVRRQGALSAINLFAIEFALQRKLHWINLGGCIASPSDGSFAHKRALGGELRDRRESHRDLLVRWPRFTPRVARFLADVPLIARGRNGLAALAALPMAEPRLALQLWQQWELPGLDRLYVIAADRWRPWRKGDAAPPEPGKVWLCDPAAIEEIFLSACDAASSRVGSDDGVGF